MKRWLVAAAVLVVAACSGDDFVKPSDAYCDDLRSGLTVMNLRDRDQDPAKYASLVYGRVSISCPEMFNRADVKALMVAWGLPTS